MKGQQRKQASERKRLAILNAAGACFASGGYKSTTAAQIAGLAGVSKGLVFHFFGSKEELYRAVIEDCLTRWSALTEHRAATRQTNAVEELRELFIASVDYARENPVLRLFEHRDEPILQQYQPRISDRNVRWRKRILATIKTGVREGSIAAEIDAKRMAVIYHELIGAMITGAMLRGSHARHDSKTASLAIDIFLKGISS